MFRLEFTTFPESYGCGLPDSPFCTARTASWRVDSYRAAPKIVRACRLQRRHVSFSAGSADAIASHARSAGRPQNQQV